MTQTVPRNPTPRDGLDAAARVLRAAGAAAGPVWAQLTPGEAHAISGAMGRLPTDYQPTDQDAIEAFLRESAAERPAAPAAGSVWAKLSPAQAPLLAALTSRESPQVAAWIISRLDAKLAAQTVRMLDEPVALAILRRVLQITPPPAAVATLIEDSLRATLERIGTAGDTSGHERVARIFDQLDDRNETSLLAGLDAGAPGAAERVRALMFTFNDLPALDAAAMQTLLAATDRATLTVALKGAREDVANVFFSNLTRRAGALIRDEIAALGPVRRAEVEAARAEIVEQARALVRTGDIRVDGAAPGDDDELVE